MNPETLVGELKSSQEFFARSSGCLQEDDSGFAPVEGMLTAAQHVAHVAQAVDWFMEGAFRPEGFDMDFEKGSAEVGKIDSLAKALAWLDRSFTKAVEGIGSSSMEELMQPLPEGPIMGGMPRLAIVGAISDHTAHHRGALTVYARLRGHAPAMPYMEM